MYLGVSCVYWIWNLSKGSSRDHLAYMKPKELRRENLRMQSALVLVWKRRKFLLVAICALVCGGLALSWIALERWSSAPESAKVQPHTAPAAEGLGADSTPLQETPADLPDDLLSQLPEVALPMRDALSFGGAMLMRRNPEIAKQYDLLLEKVRVDRDATSLFQFMGVALSICAPLLPEYPGGTIESGDRRVLTFDEILGARGVLAKLQRDLSSLETVDPPGVLDLVLLEVATQYSALTHPSTLIIAGLPTPDHLRENLSRNDPWAQELDEKYSLLKDLDDEGQAILASNMELLGRMRASDFSDDPVLEKKRLYAVAMADLRLNYLAKTLDAHVSERLLRDALAYETPGDLSDRETVEVEMTELLAMSALARNWVYKLPEDREWWTWTATHEEGAVYEYLTPEQKAEGWPFSEVLERIDSLVKFRADALTEGERQTISLITERATRDLNRILSTGGAWSAFK